ncbi:MAG TPA: transposase [Verrucomicrobia bacterium]|nr:transposase [Verrucomicrobiota bacterium]
METQVRWNGRRGGAEDAESSGGEFPTQTDRGGSIGSEPDSQRGEFKKVVGPSAKRRAVQISICEGYGNTAQVCRALNLKRSTFYRASQKSEATQQLEKAIVSRSQNHPRYGYRRVTAVLRRDGYRVNEKRTQRVRRVEGLQVKKKQRRLGESTGHRRRATRPGEVWSWDFVHDMTQHGSRFRMLTLIHPSMPGHPPWVVNPRARRHRGRCVSDEEGGETRASTQRQRTRIHRLRGEGLAR